MNKKGYKYVDRISFSIIILKKAKSLGTKLSAKTIQPGNVLISPKILWMKNYLSFYYVLPLS